MMLQGRNRLAHRGVNGLNYLSKLDSNTSNNRYNIAAITKIIGLRTILTSFHEPIGAIKRKDKKTWQPEEDVDIQRVTQTAIVSSIFIFTLSSTLNIKMFQIHELTQQQSRTIEEVVPWFLDIMPVSMISKVKLQ